MYVYLCIHNDFRGSSEHDEKVQYHAGGLQNAGDCYNREQAAQGRPSMEIRWCLLFRHPCACYDR